MVVWTLIFEINLMKQCIRMNQSSTIEEKAQQHYMNMKSHNLCPCGKLTQLEVPKSEN